MDVIDGGWGLPMTVLALVAVLAIFGSALWFILSAMNVNRKFRWFQVVDRRAQQDREKATARKRPHEARRHR